MNQHIITHIHVQINLDLINKLKSIKVSFKILFICVKIDKPPKEKIIALINKLLLKNILLKFNALLNSNNILLSAL